MDAQKNQAKSMKNDRKLRTLVNPNLLRKKSFKPHEWRFKVQKWAFRAFKTRSLKDGDL